MSHSPALRRVVLSWFVAGLTASAVGLGAISVDAHAASSGLIEVQVLGLNDFHGALAPATGSSGSVVTGHQRGANGKPVNVTVPAGGAAYLATHLEQLRAGKNSLTLAAGDSLSGSPLLSAAFFDEPTVQAHNLMGLSAATVGNHEFDRGTSEMLRMVKGGCAEVPAGDYHQSCVDGPYAGTSYPVVAANVFRKGTHERVLAPYVIKEVGGVKVGVVGALLPETTTLVTPAGIADIEFRDEADSINQVVPELVAQGVKSIVALVHQGGVPTAETWTAPDGTSHQVPAAFDAACGKGAQLDPTSAIIPVASRLDPQIDAVLTGHTHQAYTCHINDPAGQPRWVTSALANGRLITELGLKVDPATGDVVRSASTARQHVVTRDVPPHTGVQALIERYQQRIAPLARRVMATIGSDLTRHSTEAGESSLGDVVADAMLADHSAGKVAPQIAFMNPGGLRTDLIYQGSATGGANGEVTFEELYAVQPFGNTTVGLTLTGRQVHDVLRQQFSGVNKDYPRVLQVSEGFRYSWTPVGANGGAIVPGSVTVNGAPIADDDSCTYRVITNSFLATGGDGFPALTGGTDRATGGLDVDVFAAYLRANPGLKQTARDRITLQRSQR